MLSILIPVYNLDIKKLVYDLHQQLLHENFDWEIRCYEDGSTHTNFIANQKFITHLPNTTHIHIETNIGRAAIRNRLSQDAMYAYLLFLDADMQCVSNDFIKQYMLNINTADAIFGGVLYQKNKPPKHAILRWKYGQVREQISAEKRNQNPYISLKTCNILITKQLMLAHPFDERLKQYGYEDTQHAIMLGAHNVNVTHINNALLHLGLEDAETFLYKSQLAMQNLAMLLHDSNWKHKLNDITIVKFYTKLNTWHMLKPILLTHFFIQVLIKKNLSSAKPSLLLFDFYRLIYLIKFMQTQKA